MQPWVEILGMSLPLNNQDVPARKKALGEKSRPYAMERGKRQVAPWMATT